MNNKSLVHSRPPASAKPTAPRLTEAQTSTPIANPRLWSPSDPYLYTVETIVGKGATATDNVSTRIGLRWFEFSSETGFHLNGEPLKLIGTNRHQTWPYVGNAVSNANHRRDAEQIKSMGNNWVRLSHYPHDPDFLDDLDELGLISLAEGPTWMRTHGREWSANLEESFRRMIRRDNNRPGIVIWNTCINHAGRSSSLVAAAIEEDPTRARGQDNVPTPMDFRHKRISGKGALTIEHTGHTFAKASRRGPGDISQAIRHWQHINAALGTPDSAGQAVWCMYDYNTFHNWNDTGMVWHGSFCLLRLPKATYYWHKSELTTEPMVYTARADGLAAATVNVESVKPAGLEIPTNPPAPREPRVGAAFTKPETADGSQADADAPATFSFEDVTGAEPNTMVESPSPLMITDTSGPLAISNPKS